LVRNNTGEFLNCPSLWNAGDRTVRPCHACEVREGFTYLTLDIAPFAKTGDNRLEITVVETWNNRLVGDAGGDPKTRITRTDLAGKSRADSPLLPSGLHGVPSCCAPRFPPPANCGNDAASAVAPPGLSPVATSTGAAFPVVPGKGRVPWPGNTDAARFQDRQTQ
jgi:hypothetical protein